MLAIILSILICLISINVAHQEQTSGSIQGQVFAHRWGLLLPESKVTISSRSREWCRLYTNEEGSYECKGLPPGDYLIRVVRTGYLVTEKKIELRQNEQMNLDIELHFGKVFDHPILPGKIAGTVKRADGAPIPNAVITAISPFDQQITAKAVTNIMGEYNILAWGNQIVIFVSKPGFEVSTKNFLNDRAWPTTPFEINFVLKPLRSLKELTR